MGTALFLQNTGTSTTRADIIAQYLAPALLAESSSESSEQENNIGLCVALELLDNCQRLLIGVREHRSNPVRAVITFIKACAQSCFCLEALKGGLKKLVLLLEELKEECTVMSEQLPDAQKTARLMLFGYDMMPLDESNVLEALSFEQSPTGSVNLSWQFWEDMTDIDPEDMCWVHFLGTYKTAYRMACQHKTRQQSKSSPAFKEYWCKAEDAWGNMDHLRPNHPLVLHAQVQMQMLYGNNPRPQSMGFGLHDSLYMYADPATAILYLLHLMYINMQAWLGQPSEHERSQLRHTASTVIVLRDHLMKTPHLWNLVRDKILASMLILAHRFPLAIALGDHKLVHFITEQHRQQRDLLLKQQEAAAATDLSQESQQKKKVEASSVSPVKGNNELEEDDDNVPIGLRCARCEKWIAKRHEKVKCPECKATWYCGDECLSKHAQSHKAACRRAKLRSKLAAKAK